MFSSDQSGIFNIYRYRLENDEVEQLTNVIGGAFVPTVAADERVVYSGYHSNDYSLYSFEMGEFERDAHFEPVTMRDYRSIFDGPKLADQFQTATYRGRNVLALHPDSTGRPHVCRQHFWPQSSQRRLAVFPPATCSVGRS